MVAAIEAIREATSGGALMGRWIDGGSTRRRRLTSYDGYAL